MAEKRKTHLILKQADLLKQSLGKSLSENGFSCESLYDLIDENDAITWFGRDQHHLDKYNCPTKAKNYYILSHRDWSEVNKIVNDIYERETRLRHESVKRKEELNLEGIKSFNQRVWFDLSKQSNAIEGVFADFDMSTIEFERKLGEMIHINSPKARLFNFNQYEAELLETERAIQQDSAKKVVKGRQKEHPISNELIRHYIAFKYAYKCAKMFARTQRVPDSFYDEIYKNKDLSSEFKGQSTAEIKRQISFTEENLISLVNNFICLLTGQDSIPYRNEQVYVTLYGDRDFAGWIPVREIRVEGQMKSWANWVITENSLHPIEKAAIAQAEFIRIHPFQDGNGRTSRIIANFILMVNELPTIQVRGYEECQKGSKPIKYFEALNKAIRDHDANDLVSTFYDGMLESCQCVDESLKRIAKETKKEYALEKKEKTKN